MVITGSIYVHIVHGWLQAGKHSGGWLPELGVSSCDGMVRAVSGGVTVLHLLL